MARTVISPQSKGWQSVDAVALSLDLTFVAADTVNKNRFLTTGKEILLAWNTGGSGRTVTVNAPATTFGRSGSLTAYAIAAGVISCIGRFSADWKQDDGYIHLEANNAEVKFALVKLT